MAERPYSRVYWTVMDDEKFDGIRENVRHLGSWTLLLIIADMAYPAPGIVPPTIPKASLDALATCGLVDLLSGGRYRVHGLASERGQRSDSARNAAAQRWHSAGNADPMLAKTRRDEHRQDEHNGAQSARRRNTVDGNPELREQREAQVERYGRGMDEPAIEPLPRPRSVS